MTLAIVESSSGAASAAAMNPAIDVGRRRQEQHPADDLVDLVQAEPEPGRDPEVAAAAADRPEQVGLGLGVDATELAVGGHDLGREQVVDGQAVLANQVPDAAAERDPADPDRAGVAEPGREAVRARPRSCIRAAVSPVSAQAVRPSTSMSSALMSERSSTIPPSETLWPATL